MGCNSSQSSAKQGRDNRIDKCSLCRSSDQFVKSHIYPRAFFKHIGNDSDPPRLIPAKKHEHARRIRTGIYDRHLLCGSCEQLTAPWDSAGVRFARTPPAASMPMNGQPRLFAWPDQPYTELRLFALSLLWRAHASHLPELHKVHLGPHASQIRKLLLSGDPGEPDVFSVCFFKTINAPSPRPVLLPIRKRLRGTGILVWRMHLGPVEITVKVDKRAYPESMRALQLSPNSPVFAAVEEFTESTEAQMMRMFFKSRNESGF